MKWKKNWCRVKRSKNVLWWKSHQKWKQEKENCNNKTIAFSVAIQKLIKQQNEKNCNKITIAMRNCCYWAKGINKKWSEKYSILYHWVNIIRQLLEICNSFILLDSKNVKNNKWKKQFKFLEISLAHISSAKSTLPQVNETQIINIIWLNRKHKICLWNDTYPFLGAKS